MLNANDRMINMNIENFSGLAIDKSLMVSKWEITSAECLSVTSKE
jgi:hypothetical protein